MFSKTFILYYLHHKWEINGKIFITKYWKKGFPQENAGKKEQSAGTVRNRPQYLHEPSKSLIKRTEASILKVQQMQGDTSYQAHSELGFRASLHDTRLCISSEVSEYFKVIKMTKLTGGVIILGSTPRKTNHLTVPFWPVSGCKQDMRNRGSHAWRQCST